MSTNILVRDMDLAAHNNLDGPRLEVVADGLTLWHGAQLAIDTTLVSPLRRDGSARFRAVDHDGAVLMEAPIPNCRWARVKFVYLRRWGAALACSVARAFTASLLDQRGCA